MFFNISNLYIDFVKIGFQPSRISREDRDVLQVGEMGSQVKKDLRFLPIGYISRLKITYPTMDFIDLCGYINFIWSALIKRGTNHLPLFIEQMTHHG